MNFPNDFTIKQQARDAIAVLNAVGEDTAFVVGNSSGNVFFGSQEYIRITRQVTT
ncbi:MAG: hypothetical protein JJE17_06720 [Peptostreptococcaceae bacterium]|nr:hypothetical protein [Peptostreptococcaceae bacterium]